MQPSLIATMRIKTLHPPAKSLGLSALPMISSLQSRNTNITTLGKSFEYVSLL